MSHFKYLLIGAIFVIINVSYLRGAEISLKNTVQIGLPIKHDPDQSHQHMISLSDNVEDVPKTSMLSSGRSLDLDLRSEDAAQNTRLVLEFVREVLGFWHSIPVERVDLHRKSGAMTNAVFIVTQLTGLDGEPKRLLLRIYGEAVEHIFNRHDELKWVQSLSRLEVRPRILVTFANGRIEEFIESVTLIPEMMRDPVISQSIARSMARFHKLPLIRPDGSANQFLWGRLKSWKDQALDALAHLQSADANPAKVHYLQQLGGLAYLRPDFDLDSLEVKFDGLGGLAVPCHNDLQHGNILLANDGSGEIVFVDFEYGGWNFAPFDVANHFCEWASDFTDANPTPHLMKFTERYPTDREQRHFLSAYLQEIYFADPASCVLDDWIQAISSFRHLSNLFWGYWAVIQAQSNASIDFDYLGYALCRFCSIDISELSS